MKINLVALFLFLFVATANGEPTTLNKLADLAAKDPANFANYEDLILAYLVVGEPQTGVLLDAAEATRRDAETSGASDAGTTLAERPGFAELLSIAIERGAVTRSSSNGSLSLSTTPYAFYVAFTGSDTPEDWKRYSYLRKLSVDATFAGEEIDSDEDFETFTSGELKWNVFGNRSARDPELVNLVMPELRKLFADGDPAFDRTCLTLATSRQLDFERAQEQVEKKITDGRTLTEGDVIAIVAEATKDITLTSSDQALVIPCREAMTQQAAALLAAGNLLTTTVEAYLAETKPRALSLSASIHRDSTVADYGQVKILFASNPINRSYNLNGFIAFNRNDAKADGTRIKRVRDYGLEGAVTIGMDKTMTASLSVRRDSETSQTVTILQAKAELALAGPMKLPISFTYADQATDAIEKGFHVTFGLASVLDSFVRGMATGR